MTSRAGVVAAVLLVVCGLAACGSRDEPAKAEHIAQAHALRTIPVDGVDGTHIEWRLDDELTPGDPVDVVRHLIALETVGRTYSSRLNPELVGAFIDPPNLGYAHDVRDSIDPDGADEKRWGPMVGDLRIWVALTYRGEGSEAHAYPNFEGSYRIVEACIDRRKQVLTEHRSDAVDNSTHSYMLQLVSDVNGESVWKIRDFSAVLLGDTAAHDAFTSECSAWLKRT